MVALGSVLNCSTLSFITALVSDTIVLENSCKSSLYTEMISSDYMVFSKILVCPRGAMTKEKYVGSGGKNEKRRGKNRCT